MSTTERPLRAIHEDAHCTEDDELAVIVSTNPKTARAVLRIRAGTPARAALVAMVDAGVSFKRRKRCECGATCQDIGGGRCRYERDLPNQRQK